MEDEKKTMRIMELETEVLSNGCIVITKEVAKRMNFKAGEKVYFTYLTEANNRENECKAFFLSKQAVDDMGDVQIEEGIRFEFPIALLESANIEPDAELDVFCGDKEIVLRQSIVIPEDVYEICEELGICRDKVNIILREKGEKNE